MRPQQLLLGLLSFSALSAGWTEADFGTEHGPQDMKNMLGRRQDSNSNSPSSPPITASPSQSSSPNDSSNSNDSAAPISNASGSRASGSAGSRTASGSGSGTQSSSSGPKTTEYDPRDPPGGISMITPAPTAGPTYYKVGDFVTFAWNYTSLSATPSAIDVFASCSKNAALYTISVNMTVEPTGRVVWDTAEANRKQNMLSETYTLIVMDAESEITATPRSGYLAVAKDFTFPMYLPQDYKAWGEYVCATCNSGMASMERQTLTFMAGIATITVFSFTYFAHGFGIF